MNNSTYKNNIITSTTKKQMGELNIPTRPESAKMQQDSFMTDANAGENPIGGD